MKRIGIAIFCAVLVGFATAIWASAQSETLTLKMSRDWGYGGFNGDIQGLFSMHITSPINVTRVVFYLDEAMIGELDKAPYNLQFNTDNYPLGSHKLYAVGYAANGQVYQSNVISANFVPQQSTWKFMLPVLGIVLLAVLLSAFVPFLLNRRNRTSTPRGTERNYGIKGGAICPKCHRPFVLPLLSLHLGFSNFTSCPHCGKWSLVARESIDTLRQAEKNELNSTQFIGNSSNKIEKENTQREIDDTRFQDE